MPRKSHRVFVVIMMASTLMFLAGCGDDENGGTDPDTTPPAVVSDLSITAVTDSTATLAWEAPGDNGTSGTASAYDIRFATDMITDENWSTADSVATPPVPGSAGSDEEYIVAGLSSGTLYYFAIKTVDDASNWSEMSNVVSDTTLAFSETGTIILNPEPDSLNVPWTLTGPDSYGTAGNGDATLNDLTPGDYTVTWGAVSGWITPSSQEQTLVTDSTVTFTGTYIEDSEFVLVPAGSFTMGSPTDELGRHSRETQHTVTLTTSFYMSNMEVTNEQYRGLAQWAYTNGHSTATSSSLQDALDGSTQELLNLDDSDCEISFSGGVFSVDAGKEDHPVMEVTWYGAVAYCDWVSLQAGLPRAYDHGTWQCNGDDPYNAQGYRLPTEAEWEYACRAGSATAFANGEITNTSCSDPVLDQIGWYCGNANDWTHPVGQLIPNSWGLYDMHGNLWEWCNDWYAGYGGDETDPSGPVSGGYRVLRGGRWCDEARDCRSASRGYVSPAYSSSDLGFRLVRSTN